MIEINLILVGFLIIAIYLAILFFLFEIKSRVRKKVTPAFEYMIIAAFILISLETLDILMRFEIITLPYIKEIGTLLFASFFLMAAISFYKYITSYTDKRKRGPKTPKSHKTKKKVKKQG